VKIPEHITKPDEAKTVSTHPLHDYEAVNSRRFEPITVT